MFQDECCTVYSGDDLCVSSDIVSSSSVWKLAKATLASDHSSLHCLVFLIPNCLHPSFRCFSGKLKSFSMLKPGNYYNHTRFKGGVALILHTGWFCHFYVDFIMRQLKEVKLNLCQASIIEKQRLFSIFSTQTDRFYLNNIPLCSLLFRRSTENV